MIKRSAIFALTILYVITAIGFVLNLNYCCSRLTSVSLNTPEKSCSMRLGGQTKCCETRYVNVKVKDVHQHGPSFLLNHIYAFKLLKLPFFDAATIAHYKILEAKFDKRPPPFPVNSITAYSKNCMFRI